MINFLKQVIKNQPQDWQRLTTHRLDIYNEDLAKTEFLQGLENIESQGSASPSELAQLPTAYDYIRLGHQLSSVLEWVLAEINQVSDEQVLESQVSVEHWSVAQPSLVQQQSTSVSTSGSSCTLTVYMPVSFRGPSSRT